MNDLIKRLVEIPGPSGYESQIRNTVLEQIQTLAAEVRVDALGNLIARKGQLGTGARNHKETHKIMLAAHLDEIGLMVTHVDENGFARFTNLGFVRPQKLTGSRVRTLNGTIGVIGEEMTGNLKENPTLDQLYIDFGVSSRETCPVGIGDVACFERPFLDLGERLVSKAMDDRIGVAILIETIRNLTDTPHEVYFVFTTQEEVGVRGAIPAAFGVDPDIGLAVDVTKTGDTPKSKLMDVKLGSGPAIKVRDPSMISDPRIVDWCVRSAEEAKLPYQYEILDRGGTDARAIQLTRVGVPAGCISIPCRYVHTPSEMVDVSDVQNTIQLLLQMLRYPVVLS